MKSDNNICVGAGLISLDVLIWDGQRIPISYYVGGTCGNVMMILAHMGWKAFPIARLDGTKDGVRVLEDMKRQRNGVTMFAIGKVTTER